MQKCKNAKKKKKYITHKVADVVHASLLNQNKDKEIYFIVHTDLIQLSFFKSLYRDYVEKAEN